MNSKLQINIFLVLVLAGLLVFGSAPRAQDQFQGESQVKAPPQNTVEAERPGTTSDLPKTPKTSLSEALSPQRSAKEKIQEILELTATSYYFSSICVLLPGFYGSHFNANYLFLKEQYKLELLNEDKEITFREAEDDLQQLLRSVSYLARDLVDAVGCEGSEREFLMNHYNKLAITPPGEFADKTMKIVLQP